MRFRAFLYTPRGAPRLVPVGLVAFVVSLALVLAGFRAFSRPKTDTEMARGLMAAGKPAEAEVVYARLVHAEPTVPHVLALIGAHERAKDLATLFPGTKAKDEHALRPAPPMSDDELNAIVTSLPPDVAVFARAALGEDDARDELEVGAVREPPLPWSNHVLGLAAEGEGDDEKAATLLLREGLAFPERSGDVDRAVSLWIGLAAWDEVHQRLEDPRIAAAVEPSTRYQIGIHDRDWREAARALPGMWPMRLNARNVVLSAIAALAWAFFCARLGKAQERAHVRLPLYLVAFALGVVSVVPTFLLITIEEAKLRLIETGDLGRDALFFVFGVGLREEASKLLLFLPLLPILRRWGTKLDVLLCGAMVGLGFAAEENLGYLAGENLQTALGRFLTANFLHMAMTGLLASALDDFVRDSEKHASDFLRTSLLVVGLHGGYDLLASREEPAASYLAMGVFVVLSKLFLDAADVARKKYDRGLSPSHAFVGALAVVTGTSFAHAIDIVGLRQAPLVMAQGLLGEAIIIIVFVRILGAM